MILPRDATPVDFAYTVHTEVGNTCVGAKVNGRIVALRYKLRSGDIVEILTQPGHHPSRDWLQFTKSSRARQKIKHWLNVHQRERAIEIGRKLIEKEARKYRISMKSLSDVELMRVSSENGLAKPDDLLAAIGYGKFSARSILARVVPPEEAQTFLRASAAAAGGHGLGRIYQRRSPRLRRRQLSHQGERARRPAGLSRAMLQSRFAAKRSSAT